MVTKVGGGRGGWTYTPPSAEVKRTVVGPWVIVMGSVNMQSIASAVAAQPRRYVVAVASYALVRCRLRGRGV